MSTVGAGGATEGANQGARTAGQTPPVPQAAVNMVVVENPPTLDEGGHIVSNMGVGVQIGTPAGKR